MKIYLFTETDKIQRICDYLPVISFLCGRKIEKCDLSAVSKALLCYALGGKCPVEIKYGKCGKPYIENAPFFSISHCSCGIAVSVGECENGIDIQDYRPVNTRVLLRICSENELKETEKAEDIETAICSLWSEKECISKMDGRGFGMGFNSFCVSDFKNLYKIKMQRYEINLCTENYVNYSVENVTSEQLICFLKSF